MHLLFLNLTTIQLYPVIYNIPIYPCTYHGHFVRISDIQTDEYIALYLITSQHILWISDSVDINGDK